MKPGRKVIVQQEAWDCGVAALASLLDIAYEDVWIAAHYIVAKDLQRRGICVRDAERIAAEFGRPLRRIYRQKGYLLQTTGMLGLLGHGLHWSGHWVVLDDDRIIEPDGGTVWRVDAYLAAHQARPCTLLVEAQ